ncbi:hypothetical protein GCM10010080_30930 [Thermomonas carbonis]|nr:hypothetical protein GCM10010080_30930 [Thermomonas carbonis]
MPLHRSTEYSIAVGDEITTEAPGTLTTCSAWKATSPISTRQEPVPCLTLAFKVLPEGAVSLDVGTRVKVVKIIGLGLVDSQSTQVFVQVPGYSQRYLASMRLFPSKFTGGRRLAC